MSENDRVTVVLGARSYDIVVGSGLIAEAGQYISPLLRQPRVAVVTDENVAPLYLPTLERALTTAEIESDSIILPAGEQTKDFAHLIQLIEELQARGAERGMTLIALGGGVIGDLTGFAAAIHLRGIDYIQIPTTMLALVDSSVGGKTAINTKHGKNLVGAYHQPRLVIADTNVVDTLPRRELLAGYAEVVKYGLINDARVLLPGSKVMGQRFAMDHRKRNGRPLSRVAAPRRRSSPRTNMRAVIERFLI